MSTFRKRLWKDRIDAFRFFYKRPKFVLIDLTFGLIALFINPYRSCKKFLAKRGEKNVFAYGETPYTTYLKIAEECGVGPQDTWIELGAGKGKGCFWMSHFIGCKVIGIEWIPNFVFFARMLQIMFNVKGLEFKCMDIKDFDLRKATVVYLYGLWPDLLIPKGVKVITTGEPLEGYQIIKQFWVRFPWGRTTAYIQSALG